MARTAEGRALTQLHMRQQLALRARVAAEIVRLYRVWDVHEPDTFVSFQEAMVALTQLRARESAALAASYYELFRAVDAPGDAARIGRRVLLADPPPAEQIRASMSATARAGVLHGLWAGKPLEAAMRNGLVQVTGAATRLVLAGGRETIQQEVKRDPVALGWARIAGANACAFCAMLASRGPAYKEESVDFEAHDHCVCVTEPVYSGWEWPPESKHYDGMWRDAAHELGHSPSPQEWRRFYEGRMRPAEEA